MKSRREPPRTRTAAIFLLLGSVSAFLSVALGAFAAHGLKDRLNAQSLEVFKTGAQYELAHSLGLMAVSAWLGVLSLGGGAPRAARWLARAGGCFVAGILLFSGSLYALALTGIGMLGAITPFGGLCFLVGWGFTAGAALTLSQATPD